MSSDFNLGALSDHDFELLCRDLLSVDRDLSFRSFARGPDQGIDLIEEGKSLEEACVVQCKHMLGSTPAQVVAAAREEALRLETSRRKPRRYIFITSRSLSLRTVNEIAKVLTPYAVSNEDVLDGEWIRNALAANPDVVQRNFRLWLSSVGVLGAVLNSAALTRSTALRLRMEEEARTFVQPGRALEGALAILRARHTVVIAGAPGVGKTTLALMIAAKHIYSGYDVFDVREARDIDNLLRVDRSQLFLFDDFLGRADLIRSRQGLDTPYLTELLNRFSAAPLSRLVMTTREYILKSASVLHEQMLERDWRLSEFILAIEEYSEMDKARILYSHLWVSDTIAQDDIVDFVQRRDYASVIAHPNYAPRWIAEAIRNPPQEPEITGRSILGGRMLAALSDPVLLWERPFQGLSRDSQRLFLLAALAGGPVPLEDLQSSYAQGRGGELRFMEALRPLDPNFLRLYREDLDQNNVDLADMRSPAFLDFANRFLGDNHDILSEIVFDGASLRQITNILNLALSSELQRGVGNVVGRSRMKQRNPTIREWAVRNSTKLLSALAEVIRDHYAEVPMRPGVDALALYKQIRSFAELVNMASPDSYFAALREAFKLLVVSQSPRSTLHFLDLDSSRRKVIGQAFDADPYDVIIYLMPLLHPSDLESPVIIYTIRHRRGEAAANLWEELGCDVDVWLASAFARVLKSTDASEAARCIKEIEIVSSITPAGKANTEGLRQHMYGLEESVRIRDYLWRQRRSPDGKPGKIVEETEKADIEKADAEPGRLSPEVRKMFETLITRRIERSDRTIEL